MQSGDDRNPFVGMEEASKCKQHCNRLGTLFPGLIIEYLYFIVAFFLEQLFFCLFYFSFPYF